jgi:hypothetical protein
LYTETALFTTPTLSIGGLLEGYWRVIGGLLEGYWRVIGGLLEGYWRVI